MGFLNIISQLLDENSDKSFEKVIVGAIDKAEATLNKTVDKAEAGAKKIDTAGQKVDQAIKKFEDTADKLNGNNKEQA